MGQSFFKSKSHLTALILLISFFVTPVFSLEKEMLVEFLQEYNVSKNQCGGKVAYAIENDYPEIAEFLVLKGECINRYDERYPCSDCAYKKGAKLMNSYIKHPLLTAIRKGYKNLAFLMIQMGLGNVVEEFKLEYYRSSDSQNYQKKLAHKNAMHVAIESDDSNEIVLSLLLAGFDTNQNNDIYILPILKAIETKRLDIAELLLSYGADIDKESSYPYWDRDETKSNLNVYPLLKAVDDNFIEGVIFLLNHGANPTKSSFAALELAIQKGYLDIVDILTDTMLKEKNKSN